MYMCIYSTCIVVPINTRKCLLLMSAQLIIAPSSHMCCLPPAYQHLFECLSVRHSQVLIATFQGFQLQPTAIPVYMFTNGCSVDGI